VDTKGGIQKGAKHKVAYTHNEVLKWVRSAQSGDELRASKGLYLRKTEGGALWFCRYASPVTGKQVRVNLWADDERGVIGFPAATLEEAETRAKNLQATVATGVDPVIQAEEARQAAIKAAELEALRLEAERQAQEDAKKAADLERERRISVRALFDRWCLVDLKPHTRADGKRAGRKDGGQYSREQFERHVFPSIGDIAMADVRKTDVMTILDTLKSDGKLRTCNVLLADLKQMFAFALGRDIIERNPLDTVTKRQAGGTEAMRERVLSPDEIATLATLVPQAKLNQRTAAAIWLLLATGARIGELMGAAWGDKGTNAKTLAALPEAVDVKVGVVDMVAKTWHLPTTKNEREHTIHLSAFAIKQLEKLRELRELDKDGKPVPWVFPNSVKSGPVCVKSFGKQLADRQRPAEKRMSGRSKQTESLMVPGGKWTAHDLRRTAGTLMASLGISGDVIDECLNHVIESRVRRTYIRDRRPVEQARAFDALGELLEQIITGRQAAGNVVQLHAAA
jgi:integrase